jgi:hypothetical protein
MKKINDKIEDWPDPHFNINKKNLYNYEKKVKILEIIF